MKLTLVNTYDELKNVRSFIFKPESPVQWKAGQYFHYILDHPNADDRGIERWFTISHAPFEKNLRITTRFSPDKSSSFKKALFSLKVGTTIEGDGPEGSFTITNESFAYVLIAGGIGITPYRSMLAQLDHEGKDLKIDLLYANSDNNLVFEDELTKLGQKHTGFKIKKIIGNQRIQEKDFEQYVKNPQTLFYLSGPRSMVESYEHLLEKIKVAQDHIVTDYFPGY